MKKEEIQKEIEELKGRIKILEEKIEKENKKVNRTPGICSKYYFIDDNNEVDFDTWNFRDLDKWRLKANNVFLDKEKAERKVFERQLKADLEIFAEENNSEKIDYKSDNQSKYFIYLYNSEKELKIDKDLSCIREGVTYFISREIAEKAISKFKDELLRYFTSDK